MTFGLIQYSHLEILIHKMMEKKSDNSKSTKTLFESIEKNELAFNNHKPSNDVKQKCFRSKRNHKSGLSVYY